ncbi:MAG: hypothetical protein J5621_06880 [Paludibacteraceae bacterium]|nr:hypothetical protein [Paludibacteraceae bacterium]
MKRKSICILSATAICILSALAVVALCATSCNVTRTITTQSQYYQRGDTSCTIITKTVESYDGKKNGL